MIVTDVLLARRAEEGRPLRVGIAGSGDNVLIEGITVRNSPFWMIHPVLCRNITLRGVTVKGHGPNNDGVDPESVDHMLIEDCHFDTGDD